MRVAFQLVPRKAADLWSKKPMWWRAIIAGLVVAGVSELAKHLPRRRVSLLTLPIVSTVAYIAVWNKEQELTNVSRLTRETFVLIQLG
jgi:hypothetical protein